MRYEMLFVKWIVTWWSQYIIWLFCCTQYILLHLWNHGHLQQNHVMKRMKYLFQRMSPYIPMCVIMSFNFLLSIWIYVVVFTKLFFEIYMSLLSYFVAEIKWKWAKLHRSLFHRSHVGAEGEGRFMAGSCPVPHSALRPQAPDSALRPQVPTQPWGPRRPNQPWGPRRPRRPTQPWGPGAPPIPGIPGAWPDPWGSRHSTQPWGPRFLFNFIQFSNTLTKARFSKDWCLLLQEILYPPMVSISLIY